ncbi:Plug and carboxypeptidase regulatory-like domain-containing protein [Acidobacteria bacterium AH-259-D05]|nr:Plug and carboxypeptidase regulatory-like domain-containing protein [Acidobacteria bacterium AH-259-D05]
MSKQKLPKTLGILTLLVGFLFSFTVHAQFDTAAVLGTVSDESGGIIPGVTVTLTNVDTGISATTVTGDGGHYQFFNVKIGTYRVSAELTGFSTALADNIKPTVNSRQRVDLVLQVGEISQVVEVIGAAPLIESDTSDRGEVIQAKEIVGLPLNGREYSDLTLLSPGVRESEKDESREGSFNIHGLRSTMNNFMLDGVDNNSYGTSNQGFSNQVVQVAPDAVSEFKVQTNNFSAEFGRAGGAVINASLKGGTNEFHATVWEFHATMTSTRAIFSPTAAEVPNRT